VAESLVIETVDLHKRYAVAGPEPSRGVDALRGLDLQVPAGAICGFLGKNGAGKTTAIKILLGLTHATSGVARLFGEPSDASARAAELRRRVGYVSDEKDLYNYMTVAEMVRFTAAFYPRWRADLQQRYLQAFELPAGRKVKALSQGMRTKLALVLALCRGAELLILDEPTTGLDPAVTEEVLQAIVRHVTAEQTTVFFASHQIAEVEQIADRVAIVHHGRTVLSGALDDLRDQYRRVQLVFDGEAPAVEFHTPAVARVQRSGRVLTVLSRDGAEAVIAEARKLQPASVDVLPVTLKEIFLETVSAEA
jgi:ABC-2 type transport system ATP-binding protein